MPAPVFAQTSPSMRVLRRGRFSPFPDGIAGVVRSLRLVVKLAFNGHTRPNLSH
jgi:hypothetical protein